MLSQTIISFVCVILFSEVISNVSTITDEEYASMPALFHFDDYDVCMLRSDKALYCTFSFQLFPKDTTNTSKIWNTIKNVSTKPSNYRHDVLRHGVCIPETCPKITPDDSNFRQSLTECYNNKYKHAGLKGEIVKLHCQDKNPSYPVDNYDISFLYCILVYSMVIISASIYEGIARYKSRKEYQKITETTCGKFICAFSIPKNFYRLKKIDRKNPLANIQGIRFFNMICVILAHVTMAQFASPVSNPLYTETVLAKTDYSRATNSWEMTTVFLNAFLLNGGYAVQTFFLISGWLLCYNVFELFKDKTFCFRHIVNAFVLRYVRLTPTLLLLLGFHSTWLAHLSRGPFWDKIIGDEYRNCRKNWWTNFLYVNNYVNKEEMCLQQTWYLAADTQLYTLALIVVYFMKKFEKFALEIVGAVMAIGIAIPFVLAYVSDCDIVVRQYPEPLYEFLLLEPNWHTMYTASYTNITGYMMGVLCGYLYYKTSGNKIIATKFYVLIWWILSFGLPISIILFAGRIYQEDFTFTKLESSLYWAFGKNIFALGIAVGIFGMTQNIGWFVLWLLRWPPVQVLGRLSFSAYLVHVGLIKLRTSFNRQPIYVNNFALVHSTLGDVTLAYLVATVVTLMVEMPISALQKLWISKEHKKK